MSVFTFPTAFELRTIEQQKLPTLTMTDPIFRHMPIRNVDSFVVQWEQKDNYMGLQNLRGLDGNPARVNAIGSKKFVMTPGVYGEFALITEEELTLRRQFGSINAPIDLSELIMEKQDHLLQRRIDRIRKIGWDVAQGTFSVSGPNGLVHADAFPVTKYAAGTPWGTPGSSTPLADFRNVRLFEEGRSVSLGGNATGYMNLRTFNKLVTNTNANDLAGRRVTGLLSPLNKEEINKILLGEDLPQIVVHNDGYYDDNGVYTPFIPNDKVLVFGYRPSATAMEYQMVRNATNPGMSPGPYTKVIDHGERQVPRKIEVHDGHNGGPTLYFPGDMVIMSV